MKPPPEAFSLPIVVCPSCQHGIDPHGLEPGDYCGVGVLTEDDSGEGRLINVACKCLWSPNDIAAYLIADEAVRYERFGSVELRSLHVEMDAYRADLRVKVLALPPLSVGITDEYGKVLASTSVPGSISRDEALALFGGSDD